MNKSLFADIAKFLKTPSEESLVESGFAKIWRFLRVFALQYVLTIVLGVIVVLGLSLFSYDLDKHAVGELFDNSPLLLFIFFSAVFAPFFEEASFRLFLRFSKLGISLSLPFVVLSILSMVRFYDLPFVPDWLFSFVSINGIVSFLLFVVVSTISSYMILSKTRFGKSFKQLYHRYYGIILYGSILLFGLVHLTNFYDPGSVWFLVPIIILPQIVVGIALSYIRVKQGFLWAIVFHSMHNLVSTIPAILYSLHSEAFLRIVESSTYEGIVTDMSIGIGDFVIVAVTIGYVVIGIALLVGVNLFTTGEFVVEVFHKNKK